jgi:hypothetical protein
LRCRAGVSIGDGRTVALKCRVALPRGKGFFEALERSIHASNRVPAGSNHTKRRMPNVIALQCCFFDALVSERQSGTFKKSVNLAHVVTRFT